MYKHCTVCIAVQLSVHSLHSDLCGMCLGSPSVAGLPYMYGTLTTFILSSHFVPAFCQMFILKRLCLTKYSAQTVVQLSLWVMLKLHPEVEQVLTEIQKLLLLLFYFIRRGRGEGW